MKGTFHFGIAFETNENFNPCFSSGQAEPSANGTHKNTLTRKGRRLESLSTADREEGVQKPLRSVHTTGLYPQGSRVCTQCKVKSAKHCSHTETQYPSQRMQGRLHLHLWQTQKEYLQQTQRRPHLYLHQTQERPHLTMLQTTIKGRGRYW